MQTRTLVLTFTGAGSQDLPGGVYFFIKSATAALDVLLTEQNGTQSTLTSIGAGARLRRTNSPAWRYTRITSGVAQVVTVVLSEDAEFDVANTVTVSGSVTVQDVPSTTVATPARTSTATGAASSIAANPSRRRITISNPSDNATPGMVYVQATGAGAGRGIPLDTGLSTSIETTAALDIRNDSGGTVEVCIFEET